MTLIKRAVKFICTKCKREVVNAKIEEKDGETVFLCPHCGGELSK